MFTCRGVVDGMLYVQAKVSLHPQHAAAAPPARPGIPLWLMVDTGARFTVVTESLLASLRAAPIATTDVRTSMQTVELRPVYRVTLSLDFEDDYGARQPAARVLDVIGGPPVPADLPASMAVRHQGLLGLDFLSRFRLRYDGPGKQFELACHDLLVPPGPRPV